VRLRRLLPLTCAVGHEAALAVNAALWGKICKISVLAFLVLLEKNMDAAYQPCPFVAHV